MLICKTCGYETNEIFFTCPHCGGEMTTSQNKNDQTDYEKPFTKSNNSSLNDQLEQNNQYNQYNQYNNDYSEPINNYQNQPTNRYVSRLHKGYSSNMPESFKGFGSSFTINKNELKMSRFVSEGEFSLISTIVLLIFIVPCTLTPSELLDKMFPDKTVGIVIIIVLFIVCISLFYILKYCIFTVNSSGITVKTGLKEYFIPKDKIDSIVCRTVKRKELKYSLELMTTFYDLFIIMKERDKKLFNKIDLDTGLCYKNKIYVDYLIDMFNERLGF